MAKLNVIPDCVGLLEDAKKMIEQQGANNQQQFEQMVDCLLQY